MPTNFTGKGKRIVAAKIGRVAFLADEISTDPLS
jgi:hypothetical protein